MRTPKKGGENMATEAHPKRHLTKKQLDFIEEYLNCFNAVEAYIKAGYSTNGKTATINKNAYTLLNSESIQNELKEQLENIKDEKFSMLNIPFVISKLVL